jgi:hypothetical protein
VEDWDGLERLRRTAEGLERGGPDGPPVRLPNDPEDEDLAPAVPDPEPPRPWERNPGEPGRAFEAFRCFRDLGPARTVARAAVHFYRIPEDETARDPEVGQRYAPRLYGWHKRYQWRVRAEAFDVEMDRRAYQARLDAIQAMNLGYVALGEAMRNKVLARIAGLDPERIHPKDVPVWARAAQEVERMGYGMGTSVQHQITGPGGGPLQHAHLHQIDEAAIDDRIAELLRDQGLTLGHRLAGRSGGLLAPGEAGTAEGTGDPQGEGLGGPPDDYSEGDFHPDGDP